MPLKPLGEEGESIFELAQHIQQDPHVVHAGQRIGVTITQLSSSCG